MTKKSKQKQKNDKLAKENFLETHWEKIVITLLFLIPLVYFAQFLSSEKMLAGSDYLLDGYPFEKYALEQRTVPLWNPMVFGGFPMLGAPVGGQFAPLAQLKLLFPPQIVHCLIFIILFFIAGLGMYLYLKEIGFSKYSAAVGAFVYQWIGNLATTPEAGHTGRAASIATFGLMLFLLHRALYTRKINYFVLLAVIIAFAFYQGHFQITYYGLIVLIAYVVHFLVINRRELSKRDFFTIFGYGIFSIILFCLLMAMIWLPVLRGMPTVARGVERGYEYAASWNLPPIEIFDILVPNFSGGLDNYWGQNMMKLHTEFFGVLMVFFAIFALVFCWRKKYTNFFTFVGLVSLLYCFGSATPVHRLFYSLVPGFKLMRAPSLAFYLVAYSIIVIGARGFDELVVGRQFDRRKFLITSITVIILLTIVLLLIAPALGSSQAGQKVQYFQKNLSSYTGSAIVSLIVLIVIALITFYSLNHKLRISMATLICLCLTLLHQLPVMARYLPVGPAPEIYYQADDVVNFLKSDKTIFRVFPFQYGVRGEHDRDSYLLYHNIQSAGGYIANPIQRYQDLIGAGTSVMFNPQNLIHYPKYVDMLNLKYIIAPSLPDDVSRYDPGSQRVIQTIKSYLSRFRLIYKGYHHSVYQNDSVLPRAFIVADYQILPEREILDKMRSPEFDPRELVLFEDKVEYPHPQNRLSMVEARINNYTSNQVVIEADCVHPGFLVLSDNWHPDWQAYVDGKREKVYRVNYTFRAVYIPAGKHEIMFIYKSVPFAVGLIITIVALSALLGFYIPLGIWRFAVRYRVKTFSNTNQ